MAISTTGRRLLCILCFVYVLSKMLKLCSAEGSSFRLWGMLSAICCWGSIVCRYSSDSLIVGICQWCLKQILCVFANCGCVVLQSWVFWGEACQMVSLQWLEPSVSAFHFCDRRWLLLNVLCLMQRVRCRHSDLNNWSRFRGVRLFLKTYVVIGIRLLRGACVVGFYDVTSWFEYFVGCQCFWSSLVWQCQLFRDSLSVDGVRCLFLKRHLLLMSAICCWSIIVGLDPSDVCFWGGSFLAFDPSDVCFWGGSPLALISQRVCHNCLVPGFTDGAGFLCCDDVVKTENLDWIFLLDVSLLLRLTCGASVLLSTSGSFNLSVFWACKYFSGHSLHVCRFSCENLF